MRSARIHLTAALLSLLAASAAHAQATMAIRPHALSISGGAVLFTIRFTGTTNLNQNDRFDFDLTSAPNFGVGSVVSTGTGTFGTTGTVSPTRVRLICTQLAGCSFTAGQSLAIQVNFTATGANPTVIGATFATNSGVTITAPTDYTIAMVDFAVGPTGATGPSGPSGPAGSQGPSGPAGSQGPSGPAGAQGPSGPAGSQGPSGPQGAVGARGPSGPSGPGGADGAPGSIGPQGPSGPVGPTGLSGNAVQGPSGPAGVTGSTGATGDVGPTGATGAMGNMGTMGATGTQGTEGTPGATGPTGGTGDSTATVKGGSCGVAGGDPGAGAFTLLCVAAALLWSRRRAA